MGRQYLLWFMVFLFGLAAIIFLFEVTELLRRTVDSAGATLSIVMFMGLCKLPDTVERILPFVVLFAGMFTFWRLTRSSELVVARAAGVSAWQFLAPSLVITLAFGVFNVTSINPLGTAMQSLYREMEARYIRNSASLELTGAGLWLRQENRKKTEDERLTSDLSKSSYLLHADAAKDNPLTISPVMLFLYDSEHRYQGRVDAPKAYLRDGQWEIIDAWLNRDDQPPQFLPVFRIDTTITLSTIQESMARPNTVSFWRLPQFSSALRNIGLTAVRHDMRFQSLLASPILLCAMILFAAAFSLRLGRHGGVLNAVMAGIFTGSVVFFLNNLVSTMGVNQTLPIALAAWAIPIAAFAAGHTILLYLEDG